jgi:hypothetical protein
VIRVLEDRYKDILKHERTFQKLNTMRQERKIVREFNQKFLMNLDPRPTEKMLIWYYKTVVRWKYAEVLGEKKLASVEKAIIRSEKKEQEKRAHEAAYEGQRVAPKTVKVIAPMEIGKGKVICEYCSKSNHTVSMYRKKWQELR